MCSRSPSRSPAGCRVRRRGARATPTRRDGGADRGPVDSAAGHHAGGARARRGDSRGRAGVTALPILVPRVAVRGAVLADVPQLELLMAPYVATGDLLPRSNYDLCR